MTDDRLLRLAGFRIHSRPKDAIPTWERGSMTHPEIMFQPIAVVIAHSIWVEKEKETKLALAEQNRRDVADHHRAGKKRHPEY